MKLKNLFIYLSISVCSMAVYAQDSKIRIGDISTQEDTSVLIKKGAGSFGPDFEIVSGENEISGDPMAGAKESLASWKAACNSWKKDMREENQSNQVLN